MWYISEAERWVTETKKGGVIVYIDLIYGMQLCQQWLHRIYLTVFYRASSHRVPLGSTAAWEPHNSPLFLELNCDVANSWVIRFSFSRVNLQSAYKTAASESRLPFEMKWRCLRCNWLWKKKQIGKLQRKCLQDYEAGAGGKGGSWPDDLRLYSHKHTFEYFQTASNLSLGNFCGAALA